MDAVTAKVNVDLSAIKDGRATVDGALLYDHNDEPAEIELDLTGASTESLSMLVCPTGMSLLDGQMIAAALADGRTLKSTIRLVNRCTPTETGGFKLRAKLGRIEIVDPAGTNEVPAVWRFRLSNVALSRGDEFTNRHLPQGADPARALRGGSWNKLRFNIGRREWVLIDEQLGRISTKARPDSAVPLVTASLETEFQTGDTRDTVLLVADDIAVAMTLAQARDVKCISCSCIGMDGTRIKTLSRDLLVYPLNLGGHPVVDNWRQGVLRSFIEIACSEIARDRDWWQQTVGWFLAVQVNKYIEIRCASLYILLDRIAKKHLVAGGGAEIDSTLPARLDHSFQARLHELLNELSPKWDEHRTNALVNTIKEWNAHPSFVKRIRRLCEVRRIRQPSKDFLDTRHRLVHCGDLVPTTGAMEEHATELDWLVLATILRMLGYGGLMYHPWLGDLPAKLDEQLASKGDCSAS